ncbi:uncharacterized protein BT62DRAFT_90061 [Guyanagaster necrorhizus]|uniref:Uncharacterized protein n=1 Tax=Guyanagaster necrorhizus TaxID=856835 RepID=A0A9P7VTZ9_9AGAR|nr:uncharacterized protein BT62DRAFT_90061 [Guyanagaster necrorhizus MCA 3950]KAG7446837.1 hypothetical protein BT62DRAFT_90061 [Guyanagaster necrorhizus MCA 3950]
MRQLQQSSSQGWPINSITASLRCCDIPPASILGEGGGGHGNQPSLGACESYGPFSNSKPVHAGMLMVAFYRYAKKLPVRKPFPRIRPNVPCILSINITLHIKNLHTIRRKQVLPSRLHIPCSMMLSKFIDGRRRSRISWVCVFWNIELQGSYGQKSSDPRRVSTTRTQRRELHP